MSEVDVTRLRSRKVVDPVKPTSFMDRLKGLFAGFDRGDALVLLGLTLVGVGVWQISQPYALTVVGAIVLFYALPSRPPFIGGSN